MTAPQTKEVTIESIQAGTVKPLVPGNHLSGVDKHKLSGPVEVSTTGIEGDEQADRKHHGGPEMAVHHYPLEHYDAWRREYPSKADAFANNGAFGENISALGMTEENVFIGDIYKIGTVRLQVSQARQPCWKLNVRFGIDGMALRVQETGRTGWYYRVLAPGQISGGDRFELIDRPQPDWPLSKLLHYLFAEPLCGEVIEQLTEIEELSPAWRQLFQRRIDSHSVEEWKYRLTTP